MKTNFERLESIICYMEMAINNRSRTQLRRAAIVLQDYATMSDPRVSRLASQMLTVLAMIPEMERENRQ